MNEQFPNVPPSVPPVIDSSQVRSNETTAIKCHACGGSVSYSPENQDLMCDSCGNHQPLDHTPVPVVENDYLQYANSQDHLKPTAPVIANVHCKSCGAETTFPENATAFKCAFCGTPIVVQNSTERRSWQPEYILPFQIGKRKSRESFLKWIDDLWFAPNDLKAMLRLDAETKGMFLPYWTFDSNTFTFYTGKRGDGSGKKIRWSTRSGTVEMFFDDVMIPASSTLPKKIAKAFKNWDIQNYVAYDEQFILGFQMQLYQRDFVECYPEAKEDMKRMIESEVRRAIGGDHQVITSLNIDYQNVKFKHILLPLWISAFKYNNKNYIFAVNGRTGEVAGERPWSAWKIFFASVLAIAAIVGLWYFAENF